jgi:hypothetical protein
MTLSELGSKFLLRRKRAGGEREGTQSWRGREEERLFFDVQGRGAQVHKGPGTSEGARRRDRFYHTAYVYAQKGRRDGHTCTELSLWGPTTRGRSSSLSLECGSPVFAWFLSSRDNGECSTLFCGGYYRGVHDVLLALLGSGRS